MCVIFTYTDCPAADICSATCMASLLSEQMSVKASQTLGKINLNIWVSAALIAQWERLDRVMKI